MNNEPKNKKKKPLADEPEPYTFSDEATKEKIKRHIEDEHDMITAEDIARAKVPGEETPRVDQEEEEQDDRKKEQPPPASPGEGKPITPWDVVD